MIPFDYHLAKAIHEERIAKALAHNRVDDWHAPSFGHESGGESIADRLRRGIAVALRACAEHLEPFPTN